MRKPTHHLLKLLKDSEVRAAVSVGSGGAVVAIANRNGEGRRRCLRELLWHLFLLYREDHLHPRHGEEASPGGYGCRVRHATPPATRTPQLAAQLPGVRPRTQVTAPAARLDQPCYAALDSISHRTT
jgi:hypothetical protein